MSAPRKVHAIQLVKIQPEERIAPASELNLAPSSVTNCREAKGMGCWAATQVKGLSSEIIIVSVVDTVHIVEDRILITAKRGYASPTESETVARYQKDSMGTRETHGILHKGVRINKPKKGKLVQKVSWESDQRIVVMKRGNSRGAKGLAGEPMEQGHICQAQTWAKDENKIVSKTYNREALLKSRVRENLKHGSVRGFIAFSDESNLRRWL